MGRYDRFQGTQLSQYFRRHLTINVNQRNCHPANAFTAEFQTGNVYAALTEQSANRAHHTRHIAIFPASAGPEPDLRGRLEEENGGRYARK